MARERHTVHTTRYTVFAELLLQLSSSPRGKRHLQYFHSSEVVNNRSEGGREPLQSREVESWVVFTFCRLIARSTNTGRTKINTASTTAITVIIFSNHTVKSPPLIITCFTSTSLTLAQHTVRFIRRLLHLKIFFCGVCCGTLITGLVLASLCWCDRDQTKGEQRFTLGHNMLPGNPNWCFDCCRRQLEFPQEPSEDECFAFIKSQIFPV